MDKRESKAGKWLASGRVRISKYLGSPFLNDSRTAESALDTIEEGLTSVWPPSTGKVESIAAAYGLQLGEDDLHSFRKLIESSLQSYRRLDELEEPTLPPDTPRRGGYIPGSEENPLGAWYSRCSIKGSKKGPLSGKHLGIKDNVCVAGVPMMNGTSLLEGYVPEFDATVVRRILEAGGEISGKAVCEPLCSSGGSHTSDTGPVLNPFDHSRSAGGSSSGSAALVASGEVDMAIGGDQGGSITIPSSWCGVYGLKPTYGLVPYTGMFPVEMTLDHTGPIASSVEGIALLLESIAGEDGLDHRQRDVRVGDYPGSLTEDIRDLRIGALSEGFGWPGLSEEETEKTVRSSIQSFEKLGVDVEEVSVPLHRDGIHIWNGIVNEGFTETVIRNNGLGTNWKGHYPTSLLKAFSQGLINRVDELPEVMKLTLLTAEYMHQSYHGRYYAKAQNLGRRLASAYDEALQSVDVLALPTVPMKAPLLPVPDAASREEVVSHALDTMVNNASFAITGHPAMNVPCGFVEGLPVGMMLIGRRWEEETLLKAAYAFGA